MRMQIWGAHFSQRGAFRKQSSITSTHCGLRMTTWLPRAIWHGSWQRLLMPRCENHALVLRILAAAYAEAGRFDEAKKTAEQALQAAQVQGNSDLSTALRTEISLYELGLPYHKQAR